MKIHIMGALCTLLAVAAPARAQASPCDGGAQVDPSTIILDGQPLTLQLALAELRRASPALRAAGLETRARAAEADQAGRRLNPALSVELENFSGSGAFSGLNETETTFAIEQTFRLGNKRRLAQRAGRALAALGSAECGLILREAELEVATLYYELTSVMAVKELADQSAELASQLADTVGKRVEAGAAAPPELSRAQTDAALAKAAVASTRAQIERTRYALSALWGDAEPRFGEPLIADDGLIASPPTSPTPPLTSPTTHPAIKRAEAATQAALAQKKYQRSRAAPDVTLSAGFRRFESNGDQAFIAGFSVPFPLFDRNRDQTRAAGYRAQASLVNSAAVTARLLADQRASVASVNGARTRLNLLREQALPAARSAYDASLQGYAIGKFDLTTTIAARKSLIETRLAVIDAELDLRTTDMRLRSLIGSSPFNGEQ